MKRRYPHHTRRTIRGAVYWVYIQRSQVKRSYFFALGFNGCPKAFTSKEVPFRYCPTWHDAIEHAELMQQR